MADHLSLAERHRCGDHQRLSARTSYRRWPPCHPELLEALNFENAQDPRLSGTPYTRFWGFHCLFQVNPVSPSAQRPSTGSACREGTYARCGVDLLLQARVRRFTRLLMKRRNTGDSLPPGPPAALSLPTAKDFHIEWYEDINTHFNREAIRVIAECVLASYPHLEPKSVHASTKTHIQYLQKRYRQSSDRVSLSRRLQSQRSLTRKRQVSFHCLVYGCQCVSQVLSILEVHFPR